MKVRRPGFNFSTPIPAHWLGGSVFKTHLCNSFTLLFPHGEKFFIRSVQKFIPQIKDEKLKHEVKLFIRQEAQHAIEHEKFFNILREQGHDVDKILLLVEDVISKFIEKHASPKTCLALTAGFEHLTALLSEIALKDDFFSEAHPELKALFEWHALEELEHRSVAYDVLQAADPNFIHRVAGLLGAYLIFSGLSGFVTGKLLLKDKALFKNKTFIEALDVFILDQKLLPKALSIFGRYLLPGFHPSQYEISEIEGALSNPNLKFGIA